MVVVLCRDCLGTFSEHSSLSTATAMSEVPLPKAVRFGSKSFATAAVAGQVCFVSVESRSASRHVGRGAFLESAAA